MILSTGATSSLASNPFATRFVRPGTFEYQFSGCENAAGSRFAELVHRVRSYGGGVIVGPHGTGKSTLLASLDRFARETYPDVARVQLHAPSRSTALVRARHAFGNDGRVRAQQARLADRGLLIIDGAEQLSWIGMIRLRRLLRLRSQFILATSHKPIGGLETLLQTRVDASLVSSLTDVLLRDSSREVSDLVRSQLSSRDLTNLVNLRELWFEMYDVVQQHQLRSIQQIA